MRPDRCRYCDGHGTNPQGFECGFCEGGKPLDTQEDWDKSWGRILTPAHKCKRAV